VEYKQTQWQLKADIVIVSQQLAYACSADELLQHDTDLHEKQLAQGKQKPNPTNHPNQTYIAGCICSPTFWPLGFTIRGILLY